MYLKVLTCIIQPLNPSVAANGRSYFCFQTPVPIPTYACVFSFTHEALHLTGHGRPYWLIKVKFYQKAKSHLNIFSRCLFVNVTYESYVLDVLVLLRCGTMPLGDLCLT
jgi:hypothetical protein